MSSSSSSSFEPSTDLDQEFRHGNNNKNMYHDHRQAAAYLPPPPTGPPPPLPESANNSPSGSRPIQAQAPLVSLPSPDDEQPSQSQWHQQQQQQLHDYATFVSQQKRQQQPTIINYYETSPASKQGKRTVQLFPELSPPVATSLQTAETARAKKTTRTTTPAAFTGIPPSTSYFGSNRRGDATVRPNIGESNAAIGQASLQESLWKGRLVNIVACSCVIALQGLEFFQHVLMLQSAKTILGLYLTWFSILLLCYETGVQRDFIKQQFGLLHHPVGRSFLLFLMGGMAVGQGSLVDVFLGVVFVASSVFTVTTFCWYPAYRRRIDQDGGEEERESILVTARNHFWANPVEATALLHKAAIVTNV